METSIENKDITTSFGELKRLRLEVSQLCASHLAAMGIFHVRGAHHLLKGKEPEIHGFINMNPSRGVTKVSIGSTATCIRSLLTCPEFIHGAVVRYDTLKRGLERRLNDKKVDTTGLGHLNPFTVGQLLPMLKDIDADPRSLLVTECKKQALKFIKHDGVTMGRFPASGYITYWILVGLEMWGENIERKAGFCLDWSRDELYKQISLFVAGDDDKSDAFQLGYNLLIQYRYRKGQIRSAIIEQGLKTLFSVQLSRGVWEKKDPLFVYASVGNAYCFSFELLSSLLDNFEDNENALMPYKANLVRAFRWLQRNINLEFGAPCWRSGARVDDLGPESWATAEAYRFLQLYRRYLSQWLHHSALENLNCLLDKRRSNPVAFEKMYHPVITLHQEGGKSFILSDLLKDRLLEPLKLDDGREYSLVRHSSREDLTRAGILFGPPGTGKTSYVKAIAKYLGWPLLVLDPSDFARHGFPLIPTRTSQLFELLLELEDTVILFDEMEVLMRKRTGPDAGGFEEKFLTTSLLPKLQDLYSQARSLFFVATNNYGDIDEAAKREGRFDFKIQMMPPSFEEKRRMLKDYLGKDVLSNISKELKIHKENITLATRGEMHDLIRNPQMKNKTGARKILDAFKPKLLEKKDALTEEAKHNVFEKPK